MRYKATLKHDIKPAAGNVYTYEGVRLWSCRAFQEEGTIYSQTAGGKKVWHSQGIKKSKQNQLPLGLLFSPVYYFYMAILKMTTLLVVKCNTNLLFSVLQLARLTRVSLE